MEIANINKSRFIDERCKTCFFKRYLHLFEKFNVSQDKRWLFVAFYNATIKGLNNESSPLIQHELQNYFCRLTNIDDPFKEEKCQDNKTAQKIYEEWKDKVLTSINPFDLSLRLAIAGNIMDYGVNNKFDVNKTINDILKIPFVIDYSIELRNKIKQAKKILYLGDNAGEIVMDKLFIETIMHNNVFYAVKGGPALNDVTMEDAKDVGMSLVADVISNGFDAPSTILQNCSIEFLEIFNSADLIISKGQGNFEGLIHENDSRIFYLLMTKCEVISEMLNVKKGSFVVYNQK